MQLLLLVNYCYLGIYTKTWRIRLCRQNFRIPPALLLRGRMSAIALLRELADGQHNFRNIRVSLLEEYVLFNKFRLNTQRPKWKQNEQNLYRKRRIILQ